MDKKPLTEPKTEQIKAAECTYRDGYERASKRKANTIIASLNKDSSTEDEDGDRYDFVRVKKKKAKSDKSNNVESATNQNAHTSHKKATNMFAGRSFNDENSDTEINNERVKHLGSKTRSDEKDETVSPELTAYPRRITPPNARLTLNRQRRANATSKAIPKTRRANENKAVEQVRNQHKDNTMTEEEIRRKLEEDWNEEEEVAVEKDVEIRPLPISRDIRSRLRQKQLSVSKTKTAKEMMRDVAKKGEESDEEQNKKKRLKVSEQQKEEELCGIKNRNGSWEHQLLSDDEDRSSEMNRVSYLKISLSLFLSLFKYSAGYCYFF